MLFNSYEFILLYFPLTVIIFSLLSQYNSRQLSLGFLAFSSLFFYGWWNPLYLILISLSLITNYSLGTLLQKKITCKNLKTLLLIVGIFFNLGLLGYYKYGGFLVTIINDVYNKNFNWVNVILPLGISFFTFQQITYLIDSSLGRVNHSDILEYILFVTFFPQLIAGPIVHHKEMMPQFRSIELKVSKENLQIGFMLFVIGLFKKVILADSISGYVGPIYDNTIDGSVTFLQSWLAGAGFTLQIYFDFAGYSDMALGAARVFGIVLPMNFNSPLKASSIIEFWGRWHITLTRFLTAYIFTPLSFKATRTAALRKSNPSVMIKSKDFLACFAVPVLITMFLSGFWHGAGYQFLIWGTLHGLFLVVNHAWRLIVPAFIGDRKKYERLFQPVGLVVTLALVFFAMIFFRAKNCTIAFNMAVSMLGLNGISIPEGIFVHLGSLKEAFIVLGITPDSTAGSQIAYGGAYCILLLFIALVMPNSLDMMRKFKPALNYSVKKHEREDLFFKNKLSNILIWRANRSWAIICGFGLAVCLMSLQRLSVFLYWQF